MATLRSIKRRIRSVKNISQVTRAMQMVAASKMRRAQEQVSATRAYAEKAWELLIHLASQPLEDDEPHPLLTSRPVQRTGLVLITSDKGLAGGYNHNIVRRAMQFIQGCPTPVKLITVGRKGRDFMLRAGMDIAAEFLEEDLPSQPSVLDVAPIARAIIEDFERGEFDEVYLAYTIFHTTMSYEPVVFRLLPICNYAEFQAEARSGILPSVFRQCEPVEGVQYIYEPGARALLNTVIPRFTELQVYQAILESLASEHSSRVVAMRSATDNALELIDSLTVTYHRARQEAITREILDIVGGAEAQSKMR